MAQGLLGFEYEEEKTGWGGTALAGLPVYVELAYALGLCALIQEHLRVRSGEQGWSDIQIVIALILLNLAGGDCVEDLERLEQDDGFRMLMLKLENYGERAPSEEEVRKRWRKGRERGVPSPSVAFRYLDEFHDEGQEKLRQERTAFIPAPNEHLQGLSAVQTGLVEAIYNLAPVRVATLDLDATLIQTQKANALYCYKKFPAYQPLNVYFSEMGLVLHSEFRDGNVPAGYQLQRVLEESLAMLPEGVEEVRLRSDTAAYQIDLLKYCAMGKNERFGVIRFAIGCDITPEFKAAVAKVAEAQWRPLYRMVDGKRVDTKQEWAEVLYVSSEYATSKNAPQLRYLAVREALPQQPLPELGVQLTLPFPTVEMKNPQGTVTYKLHAVVSNESGGGDGILWWYRGRCGKSEEAHSVMKEDLAGGQMPSFRFGANAAWWGIMLLAMNLETAMKRLVMEGIEPGQWAQRRMKAVRFNVINLPGRVVVHSGQMRLRLGRGHPALALLVRIRDEIQKIGQWLCRRALGTIGQQAQTPDRELLRRSRPERGGRPRTLQPSGCT